MGFTLLSGAARRVFFGEFDSAEEVARLFDVSLSTVYAVEILVAGYAIEDYSGSAVVVYRDAAGKLFVVEGSHCSCFGLEDQWVPAPVTAAYLRTHEFHDQPDELNESLREALRDLRN